jgi:hypothetical protein
MWEARDHQVMAQPVASTVVVLPVLDIMTKVQAVAQQT